MRGWLVMALALTSGCWISDPQEFATEYAESFCRVVARCDFAPGLGDCEAETEERWLELDRRCASFDVGAARRCVAAWDDRVEDAICSLGEPPDCLEVFDECAAGALEAPW